MRALVLIALLGVVLLFVMPTPTSAQSQGPIRIVFDMHCDPIPNDAPYAGKYDLYSRWVDNMNWVLDQTEPLGAEIAFLSSGSWMEFVVADGPLGGGAQVLRRIYFAGGQIGSHSHNEYRAAPHDWPGFSDDPPLADSIRSWEDNIDWVNQAIDSAFAGSPPEPLASINNVKGSHLPKSEEEYHLLMDAFDLEVRQPGPEEDYYGWFNHHIWNPFRPSADNTMAEDLSAPFVQVTQGAVIGNAGIHHGVFQDMTAPQVKRQFLQLYLNWRYRDRHALPEKIWCWGWGSHASDFDPADSNRDDLVEVLQWLGADFAGRIEPTGSTAMAWDTHRGVGEAFLDWEANHPGESSFSFDSLTVDWDEYPYLRAAAEEMAGFGWFADLSLDPAIEAYHLKKGPLDAVVLWRSTGSSTVDLSPLVGPNVRVIGLETGVLHGTDPSSVTVDAEPRIVTEEVSTVSLQGVPSLGSPITFRVQGPPEVGVKLAASRGPKDVVKPHLGRLLIDPADGLRILGSGSTSQAGIYTWTRTVPDRPSLLGKTFHVQGAVFPFEGASLKLTINVIELTIEE